MKLQAHAAWSAWYDILRGKYFILWDIVDPRTESNPNPNPNPEPNPKPNPNPDPNCGFTISHKMKYLRTSPRYARCTNAWAQELNNTRVFKMAESNTTK